MQKEPKVLIQTFSDDEVRSLLSAFDYSTYLSARNKMILAIAFDTGARNTEICQIKREDIHDNVILIHGKRNKERHVPISPYLQKVMLKYERIHFSFGSIRKQGATIGSLLFLIIQHRGYKYSRRCSYMSLAHHYPHFVS